MILPCYFAPSSELATEDLPRTVVQGGEHTFTQVLAGEHTQQRMSMLEEVLPTLEGGVKMLSQSVECAFGEGTIGDRLGEIQKSHPETSIGSYPRFDGKVYSTQIVVRSRSQEKITNAVEDINASLEQLRKT